MYIFCIGSFAPKSLLSSLHCPVVVTGDLNLHLDVADGKDTRRFQQLLDTFGLSQSVLGPTHKEMVTHSTS